MDAPDKRIGDFLRPQSCSHSITRISESNLSIAHIAGPGHDAHHDSHHRERGYLTGVPVQDVVQAVPHMPAPAASGQRFTVPEKRIRSQADLER